MYVKDLVLEQRMLMPRLGTRKLYYLLKNRFDRERIKVGRDKLFIYLRDEHLLIEPKKNYTKTTQSKHWLHKYPNIAKGLNVNGPEQLWVSDITYLKTKEKSTYLSLVTDAYSRKIMGYNISSDLRAESVSEAVKMAIKNRLYDHPVVHHSDRGLQYCSEVYQNILRRSNIVPSMTDGYDCYQNALAERMNGIIKNEFLVRTPNNEEQAITAVKQSIYNYNNLRPHLSLNYKTPQLIHKKYPSNHRNLKDICKNLV
jgi:transposase InsO family protein